MEHLTIEEVIAQVFRTKKQKESVRKGQHFFTTLESICPIAAEKLVASIYDPYYRDDKITPCCEFLNMEFQDVLFAFDPDEGNWRIVED